MNDEQFETVKKLIDLTPGAGFAQALESRVLQIAACNLPDGDYIVFTRRSPSKDEKAVCSSENLNSICQKFLPKFPYSTLQIQDSSVGPTKAGIQIEFD